MDTNGHIILFEDYVSFEIAKLLKEKGFDGKCRMIYREHDKQRIYHTPNPDDLLDFETNKRKLEKHSKKQHCQYLLCPTLQMALKWLREVHNIEIAISYGIVFDSNTVKQVFRYFWSIVKVNGLCLEYPMNNPDDTCYKEIEANSYEEAIEAALLYVLKNLI